MTPEEAIKVIRANYPPENYIMFREALDAAVDALEQIDSLSKLAFLHNPAPRYVAEHFKRWEDSQLQFSKDLMENLNNLLSRAQKAEAQNRLLKEKLIEKLGQLFHQFGDLELDPPGGVDRKFARDQLRAEMPEVGW